MPIEAHMLCASCGACMRLDTGRGLLTCPYCGREEPPPAGEEPIEVLGKATDRLCPACQSPLSEGRIASHELLYCNRCRGMLIGMDSFLGVIETLRDLRLRPARVLAPRDEAEASRSYPCPVCEAPVSIT